jgi:hypothetical protein
MTALLVLLCVLALILPMLAVLRVVGAGIRRADAEAAVVAEAERILAGAR